MFHQLDFRYLVERLLLAGGQDTLTQHLNHPIEFGIVELGGNALDHKLARQHAGVDGATPAKNSALTSAGGELRLANGVTLLAEFDGEFASHSSTYAGTGTFRYRW